MRGAQAVHGPARNPLDYRSERVPVRTLIKAAWPFIGISAAVASVAWLPVNDTKGDAAILVAVVFLGGLGLRKLLSLAK
jgi:hypothetical protein